MPLYYSYFKINKTQQLAIVLLKTVFVERRGVSYILMYEIFMLP